MSGVMLISIGALSTLDRKIKVSQCKHSFDYIQIINLVLKAL